MTGVFAHVRFARISASCHVSAKQDLLATVAYFVTVLVMNAINPLASPLVQARENESVKKRRKIKVMKNNMKKTSQASE